MPSSSDALDSTLSRASWDINKRGGSYFIELCKLDINVIVNEHIHFNIIIKKLLKILAKLLGSKCLGGCSQMCFPGVRHLLLDFYVEKAVRTNLRKQELFAKTPFIIRTWSWNYFWAVR